MPRVALKGARVVTAEGVARRDLVIERDRIVEGGETAERISGTLALDLADHLVFPGLVNAHDHLLLNAYPRPEPVAPFPNSYAWIEAFQPRFEDPRVVETRALPKEVRAFQGGLKNLLSGVTDVCHHDPWIAAFEDPAFPVRVVRNGWCHSLGLAGRYGPSVAESLAATPPGARWFIHLAEGTDAVAAGELDALDRLGALTARTVLVHGVGLSGRDVAKVVESGAAVVWCPQSNRTVLGCTLEPRRLFEAGRLALGTDSRLSGAFDLLHELRVAAEVSDLKARELLRIVTRDARRILGNGDSAGLEAGDRADLFLVRDGGGDPFGALLATRRADLRGVVRNGRPLFLEPDLEGWFVRSGVPFRDVRWDGRAILAAESLLSVPDALRLEPGLVA